MRTLTEILNENILNQDEVLDRSDIEKCIKTALEKGLKISVYDITSIFNWGSDEFLDTEIGKEFARKVVKKCGVDVSGALVQYIHDHIHFVVCNGIYGNKYDPWINPYELPTNMYVVPRKDKGIIYKDVRSYKFKNPYDGHDPKMNRRFKIWLKKRPDIYPDTINGSKFIELIFDFVKGFKNDYVTYYRAEDEKYVYVDNIYSIKVCDTGGRKIVGVAWTTFSDWQSDMEKELNDLILRAI